MCVCVCVLVASYLIKDLESEFEKADEVYVNTYIYSCVFIYVYVCECISVLQTTRSRILSCLDIYTCMYMYIYMYIYIDVCLFIYINICRWQT